jgi:transketolase
MTSHLSQHMGKEGLVRAGLIRLLELKDCDIRILTLEQAREAVDKGIHAGGAFSAVIPLVAMYYGGFMKLDVADPTRIGQDMFVLSKGHAVASMASIYADLGYFDRSILKNSRSGDSILNGHPGPILPGVHVSTGPLGQGVLAAQGMALAGRRGVRFDVFTLAGDGELQEGLPWEGIMHSAHKRLDNLCLIVDNNEGQLDNPRQLLLPMRGLDKRLASFGWRVFDLDGSQYAPIVEALWQFKYGPRDGRPTAIISHTTKGWGSFSSFLVGHKVEVFDSLCDQEIEAQKRLRGQRSAQFSEFWASLGESSGAKEVQQDIAAFAEAMNLELPRAKGGPAEVRGKASQTRTLPAKPRDKRIAYDPAQLPVLDAKKEYAASAIITQAMKVFARDPRVVSVDADLSSTSGLEPGVGWVDSERALNVGIAEGNMMVIGEAYAALGYNAWVSTFCPFFDWKVLRRIAIGHQERLEAMAQKDGWLTKGHGLDLTFLATAPNFETKTNGATHMGNDDALVFGEIGHLKIVDVSCPNQLLALMKWIMEGDRGLLYVRIMRSPSAVLYPGDVKFEFAKAYVLKESAGDLATIVSSGRGVHEALAAAKLLEKQGVTVGVVDMPSTDAQKLLALSSTGKPLVVAEQNNGNIWSALGKLLLRSKSVVRTDSLLAINTLSADGTPQFIHSATYEQLLDHFGLSAGQIAASILKKLQRPA